MSFEIKYPKTIKCNNSHFGVVDLPFKEKYLNFVGSIPDVIIDLQYCDENHVHIGCKAVFDVIKKVET